jgi:hypothetical protein
MPLSVVHMFWHGPALSRIERLCMMSFLEQGHAVHLHTYEAPAGVPRDVTVCDAGAVLPREAFFVHKKTGSPAAFADWFRYRVLLERGGIWSDTDVVCLKPLIFVNEEIYARQDANVINNAILGLPANHPLATWMSECCESPNRILPYDDGPTRRRKWRRRLLEGNRRGNVKWGEYGPKGFTEAARYLGYADQALPPEHFYPIPYKEWRRVFYEPATTIEAALHSSSAIHLWNEMTRREPRFDKNASFPADSLFERLCSRYLTNDS